MFSDPAQARLFGPGLLHDWAGIGVGTGFGVCCHLVNHLFQFLEPGIKKLVIVFPPSISRNTAVARPFVGTVLGEIVDPQRDD